MCPVAHPIDKFGWRGGRKRKRGFAPLRRPIIRVIEEEIFKRGRSPLSYILPLSSHEHLGLATMNQAGEGSGVRLANN
jgi:hypothetical protein